MNMEKTETLSYKLDVFEGPLDLLLNLIAKNKLNIYDIPIAELLEQYMAQQCKDAAMRLRERFSLDGIVRAQADIPADLTYKRRHKPQELLSAYLSMLGKKKPPEPRKPEDTISKLITLRGVVFAAEQLF